MKYENIIAGRFVDRPNRFIAHVDIDGNIETVHVKNTGRCRELLIPGAEVYLTAPGTPGRKTRYDLVAVRKGNGILFNIDSQAPNDAPTERGVKHLHELTRAVKEGYEAIAAFVIQMDGVTEVRPNTSTHPEFGEVLEEAKDAGVKVLPLPCHVEPDSLTILPATQFPW